jgi:photosystem II stability/assembly factor-like uncharacterized protein
MFVYKSTDGGSSWNLNIGLPFVFGPIENTCITFTSPDTGYLCGDGIYKTTDAGLNWFVVDSNALWSNINFPTKDTGYVVGFGRIAKTNDGVNWTIISLPFTNLIYNDVFFTSADTGYIAAGNGFNLGVVLKTTDGGLNLNIDLNGAYPFQSIHFPSNEVGYVCGDGGSIYKKEQNVFVSELSNDNFYFYPNPSTGVFNFNFIENNSNIFKIEIYNELGINVCSFYEQNKIDLTNFSKGIYFAKLFTDKGVSLKKLILC